MSEELLIRIEGDEFVGEDVKEKIQIINNATTLMQQLKDFKDLAKFKIDDDIILGCLIKLYFTAKVKHPIKNCILNAFRDVDYEISYRIINEVIPKMILNLQHDESHHMISCINEASKSFKIAIKVIGQNPEKVMEFLTSMLKLIYDELKNERSPSEKNKISVKLHAAIQAIICCAKNHLQEKGKAQFEIENYFKIITDICMDILSEEDLSMDTKNNCGILIVMRNDIINDESHYKLIKNEDENCFKRLCLISGVILILKIEDDQAILTEMCRELSEIFSTNSVDSQVVIAVSRLFVQVTKKLLDENRSKYFDNCHMAAIIINISLANIEHTIDAVKHLSKNSLKNLIECGEINSFDILFLGLKKSSITVQAAVIQCIISVTSVHRIFKEMPNLQSSFLSSIHKYKENILTCYELISNKCYDELKSFEWFATVIQPIIEELTKNHEARGELRELLSQCIKKDARAVEIVLKNRNDFDAAFSLTCLNAAKKAGLLDSSKTTTTSWRGVVTYDEIKMFIVNFDEKVQFSILQLLVETKKSTEEFDEEEIECIFYFYQSNINIQSPSIRQSIIGMTKKFFERLSNLIKVYRRRNDEKNITKIFETCVKFQDFAINNLDDGSNHSRRMLSLKMLVNVLDVLNANFSSDIAGLWNEDKFDAIFNMFYDNYEANKTTALEVMNFIPRDEVGKFSKLSLDHLERLMTSIKTSDGLAAAYLIQYAINFSLFEFSLNEKSEIFSTSFNMLIWCESILLKALTIAQKSIIISSGSYTIYGPMLCIRYLTLKLNFNDVQNCPEWKQFFSRIIKTCRHLTEVVAKIVNSSSPEGAYPNEEIENIDEETLKTVIKNTTPQIVLVNAWRTVKEVSLFLGDLSLRCSGIILSTNEMLEIADHLSQLMRKTIHRGAFEQAFYGFSQLCIALRLSHDPELHNLPLKILELLISSLSGEAEHREDIFGLEIKNVSATRRSAGLPFTFQALLVSEIKIASSSNFHFVMRNLITYARHGKQLGTRVHSLNILRGLFRCTELSEGIMEYISQAMQCSLLAYDVDEWAESNSSTLLFSALMIRIFGPQKTKNNDELSVRNKMNAKVFFQRFPELYSFIFKMLRQAEQKVQAQVKNTKLHPLLLLLNRLNCSNSDDENPIKLTEFMPIISSCSGCVELQTRILCAKFIAHNTPANCVTKTILSIIKSCREDAGIKTNAKHGKLLIILHLCKRDCVTERESSEIIKKFFELIKIFKINTTHLEACFLTDMDVMIECFSKLSKIDDDLRQILAVTLNLKRHAKHLCYADLMISQKKLALSLLQFQHDNIFDWILLKLKNAKFYEQQVKLNGLLMILDYDYAENVLDENDFDPKICEFFKKLSKEKLTKKRHEIRSNSELKETLLQSSLDINHKYKCYEILSYLNYTKGDCGLELIKDLTENAISEYEAMGNAMLKYTRTCLMNEDKDFLLSINWEFLINAVDSTYLFKLSTLDLMKILAINITFVTCRKTLYFYTKAMLNLLMDDDIDVRLKSSKIVSSISNHKDIFIASYAQSIFLKHLEDLCDKHIFLALIILLAQEHTQYSNQDESEEEFQVFEKNDSNTFKERFLIKQLCTSICLSEKGSFKNIDDMKKILNVCREIKGESFNEAEMTTFCDKLLK